MATTLIAPTPRRKIHTNTYQYQGSMVFCNVRVRVRGKSEGVIRKKILIRPKGGKLWSLVYIRLHLELCVLVIFHSIDWYWDHPRLGGGVVGVGVGVQAWTIRQG